MSEILTAEHFRPHLGTPFHAAGWPHPLVLHEIEMHNTRRGAGLSRDAFTLIFHGPRGEVLAEAMHVLEAESGGRFELYIIPIHTVERDRQDYQAVFN